MYSKFLVAIIAMFTGSNPPGYGRAGMSMRTDAKAKQIVPRYNGLFSIERSISTNKPTVSRTVNTVSVTKAPLVEPSSETI
jgi:hypothetical protein